MGKGGKRKQWRTSFARVGMAGGSLRLAGRGLVGPELLIAPVRVVVDDAERPPDVLVERVEAELVGRGGREPS